MTQEERIAALEAELAKHKSKLTPYEEHMAKWRAENPERAAYWAEHRDEQPPYNPYAIQDAMVNRMNPGRMMVAGQMKSSVKETTKDGKTVWSTTTNDDRPGYRGGIDPRDRPGELNGPAGIDPRTIVKRGAG